MNPLLSLCIVLVGIVVVVYILSMLRRKNLPSFKGQGIFEILQMHSIDAQYKIVLLKIGKTEKALLLGPTNALELSYERHDRIKSADAESTGCTDKRD